MKRLYIIAAFAALVLLGIAPHELRDTSLRRAPAVTAAPEVPRASFGEVAASDDTRGMADWIVRSRDNEGLPFIIIDKLAAAITVFDPAGRAYAAAPVLLGIARGDRFAPGVADKDMYQTTVDERITPAGRFLGQAGINTEGEDVVWIQYDAGIAMHAVVNPPGQRRPERLATPTPEDNRISYGCVNLPTDFYRNVVRPLFDHARAVVYVLPDSENPLDMFARAKVRMGPGRRQDDGA